MAFTDIYRISSSAMTAQTVRLNTIASKMANADAASASEDSVYKARRPVFASIYQNSQLAGNNASAGARVQIIDVVETG